MPPVRWKLALAVAAICLTHISSSAKTGRELAEDGWKPIVGRPSYSEEIPKYRSPSNLEPAKIEMRPSTSEPIPPPQPPPPKPTVSTINNNNHQHGSAKHKMKAPSHTKHQNFHYSPNQGHGHQIPVNLITHRSQNKPYKMPVMGKNHGTTFNGKRPMKPPRLQTPAHSNRDEMLIAAPSTAIGNYAYFAQGPASLKTRLPPTHGHIDFGNRFAAPSEDFFQFQRLPVQQYVLPKYQIPNDVHYAFQNDEYTRNLVPPLPSQKFPEVNNKQKAVFKQKQQPVTEQAQVTKSIAEQMQTSLIPENILVQVPPPYQHQQAYYVTNQNEPVDVQVTKEKLNVFHNNIPANYNNEFAQFGRYQFEKKPSEAPKPPTYEVTEGKVWQQTPEFRFQYSSDLAGTRRPQIVQSQVEKVQFLPTPLKPESLLPTSATRSEISTVYSEVSKINRQKEMQGDPSFFTVKEVSTHYPILGQPDFKQQFNLQFPAPTQDNSEYSNEITTSVAKQQPQEVVVEVTETPTVPPSPVTIPSRDWQHKRRPGHRRRKPVRPTTPEASEELKSIDVETTTARERPLRRRPSRYRTTEATPVVEDRPVRIRQRQRPRPTEESMEVPQNHRLTTEYFRGNHKNYEGQYQRTPERDAVNGFGKFGKYDDSEEEQPPKPRRPTKYRIKEESEEIQSSETFSEEQKSEEQKYMIEEVISGDSQEETEQNVEKSTEEMHVTRSRRPTTDQIATTNIHTPENEIDYSTINPAQVNQQETITIEEIHTQTPERTEETTTVPTTTTPTTTTTTSEATTTKSNRLRRPINYKSSPRPRFSVKEYRQRLNQYTSTSTEASSRPSTESTSRIRYPHRSRKPIMRYQQELPMEEEVTDIPRTKFVPKSPRYSTTTESRIEEDEAEKVMKTNSRMRPYGRTRSTTEATTTTQKVSVKQNVFSNLRRPPQISLRNRIFNRYNRNSTTEKSTTTTESDHEDENLENETSEVVESTETFEKQITSTEGRALEVTTVKVLTTSAPEENEFETTDVVKNEAVLQSQRVSDLTSSAQNDYNTPGIFKSVSSNVRRVPSYFTIATDDPILPIEAFFTNLNKEKDKY